MGLKILQVNIRNFKRNKYPLLLEISNCQPELILLNELGVTWPSLMKINGYKGIWLNNHEYFGIAIFTKIGLEIEYMYFRMGDILAVKILTSMGQIIVATAYSQPKNLSLPTVSLNHLFSHRLPVLFVGDLNAHHRVLNNDKNGKQIDGKGRQLSKIINQFNLNVLGPDFDTFVTKNRKGRPDVVLSNNQLTVFNHMIYAGNDVGSDHVPIIVELQIKPFRKLIQTKCNLSSIHTDNFRKELSSLPVPDLNGKHKSIISSTTKELMDAIVLATENNSEKFKCQIICNYKPSDQINNLMIDYQVHAQEFYYFGQHNKLILDTKLEIIINLMKDSFSKNWQRLVELASECQGDNTKFWRKFNKLRGAKSKEITQYLKIETENLDSSDSEDYGNIEEEIITDKQEQANVMSKAWNNIFNP